MKIIVINLFITCWVMANTLPSEKRKNGPLIQATLAPVQVSLQESSASFYNQADSRQFLYGTVVSEDGYVLTKASELAEVEEFYLRIGRKKYRSPEVVARSEEWDLVLIKVEAEGLRAVDMRQPAELAHGTWIVCNGADERRFRRAKAGIISANQRVIPGGVPGVLGVTLLEEGEGVTLGSVNEKSGAFEAGLEEGDELLEVEGAKVENRKLLVEFLEGKLAGELIQIKVKRGAEFLHFKVELRAREEVYGKEALSKNDQLSGGVGEFSARRTGFPMVIQHEAMLKPRNIGGPVFTLEGGFVGMNIAAVNRVEAFAIPAKELAVVLAGMMDRESD